MTDFTEAASNDMSLSAFIPFSDHLRRFAKYRKPRRTRDSLVSWLSDAGRKQSKGNLPRVSYTGADKCSRQAGQPKPRIWQSSHSSACGKPLRAAVSDQKRP